MEYDYGANFDKTAYYFRPHQNCHILSVLSKYHCEYQ